MRVPLWRWVVWAVAIAAVTFALLALRARVDKSHIALVYLLVVLVGTVSGGRRVGLALAAIAFLLFNWFFIPPYNTLVIHDPLDWLVLLTFLIVSALAAQILHRLQAEAETARRRASEIDRFATLGAETLNVGRADEALAAIADVIRRTLDLRGCRIHTGPADDRSGAGAVDPLVTWTAENGRPAIRQADGTARLTEMTELSTARLEAARGLFLPLQVRGRTVGVLELASDRTIVFAPAQERFLTALAYYAALAVERVRLTAEADRAEAFREADRLKNALLASVSHDLRTPLTTIKALAHDLAGLDDRAVTIEEEADRLNRLVADLLDLSRVQGDALSLALELNAIDDLVGALVQRVSGILAGRELLVELENGGTLLVGRFDLVHALRVLVNLVENAHKYAPPGTPIELMVRHVDGRIELTVGDRGPGVPETERERIFEPFYRAAGTPPDTGGTGLGLAIARGLAEAQGGALTHAHRPGGGSRFTLTLPAADLTTDLRTSP